MKINRLVLEGEKYKRTLVFNYGINIIEGDFMSGKSLVLELIRYCLGGKYDKLNKNTHTELFLNVDKIYLEYFNFGHTYTVMRYLKKNQMKNKVFLYNCKYFLINTYLKKEYSQDEFCEYLYKTFKIPEYAISKKSSSEDKKFKVKEKISFRDIFRYVYIPQHELGTNNFLGSNDVFKKIKNKYSFEILLDIVQKDNTFIIDKIIDIENELNEKKVESKVLKNYIEKISSENLSEGVEKLENQIKDLNLKKEDIKNNKIKIKDNSYVTISKNKRDLIDKRNLNIKEIKELKYTVAGNNGLLNNYNEELIEIKATIEGSYNISIDKNIHSCPLCNSDVYSNNNEIVSPEEIIKNLEITEKEINDKIILIEYINTKHQNKINSLNLEVNNINNQIEKLELDLEIYNSNDIIPFFAELEIINNKIVELERNRQIKLEFNKHQSEIFKINNEIEKLENLKFDLEKDKINNEEEKKEILSTINIKYTEIIKKYSRINYDLIDISNNYIPSYNEADVTKQTSGGLLITLALAYLGVIAENSRHHPKFLMFDTIRKYFGTEEKSDILDKEMYQNIYKYLENLSKDIQIILVDNTPPIEMDKYVKYTLHQGIKNGLIDLTKNEKNVKNIWMN